MMTVFWSPDKVIFSLVQQYWSFHDHTIASGRHIPSQSLHHWTSGKKCKKTRNSVGNLLLLVQPAAGFILVERHVQIINIGTVAIHIHNFVPEKKKASIVDGGRVEACGCVIWIRPDLSYTPCTQACTPIDPWATSGPFRPPIVTRCAGRGRQWPGLEGLVIWAPFSPNRTIKTA